MGARSYWVFALAVMLGMAWLMAAEFGWVGSRAKTHAVGTYGSAYLKRGQSLDIDGGQPDLSWDTVRIRRVHVPFVVAERGAGLVLAGNAPWEKIDRAYLARLTYSSARLHGGGERTVLALHTAQGNYAKLRMVRRSDDGEAMWEWVVYSRPEVHKSALPLAAPMQAPVFVACLAGLAAFFFGLFVLVRPGLDRAASGPAAAAPDSTGTAVPVTTPAAHDAPATWGLVAANLVPAAGIAFWGWTLQEMVMFYWIETVVMCALAALFVMLVFHWNPVVDKVYATRAELDLEQIPEGDSLENLRRKLGGGVVYFVLFGLFCAGVISWMVGLWMAGMFFEGAPLLMVLDGFMREPGAIFAVLAIIGYQAYAFFRNYNDDMLAQPYFRPFFRVFVMNACMFVLFPFMVLAVGLKFPVVSALVYVAFKICVESMLLKRERKQSAGKQAPLPIQQNLVEVPPLLASQEPAPPPVATQRPVLQDRQQEAKPQPVRHDLNDRPLAHYMGAWRLAPGQLETPGWFAGAEFLSEAGKLKLRLTDQAGIGDAPDVLESVSVRGNAERIEFIEVRLRSGGLQRILRFTASGADPERVDLNEIQHPEGNPGASQARSFSLRRG